MTKTVTYPYDIKKVQLSNGCNIAYVDEGKGDKTILFIHGLATYSLTWQKNIDYLKQYYRCIAIDLPGNGLSDRGDYSYSIDFFAGSVYDFILKLKLKNLCIAGHSMGGQIAMTLLKNQPECANELILCAPAGFETFTAHERTMYRASINFLGMFSTDENSLRQTIRTSFYHYPTQADDMVNHLVDILNSYPLQPYRKMIDACIDGMLKEAVHDDLPSIKQRTLVLFGELDALIPNKLIHPISTQKLAESCVKRMPNAKLEILPMCGHFLQWEKADKVNQFIHQFLPVTA